jgi:hypothetical protein
MLYIYDIVVIIKSSSAFHDVFVCLKMDMDSLYERNNHTVAHCNKYWSLIWN